ncbi:MAG: hypothetical protein LBK91_07670, partial [Synergistaceae bacterium]|nr:hypothetical protein [Synergistaceae bacterium]
MSGRNGARGTFAFDTVTLEGGLFSADLLEKICAGDAPFQSRDDYAIPKGIQISGEYGRAFHIAKAQWADFKDAFGADDTRAVTVNFLKSFLRDVMGFSGISELRSPILISESSYPITLAIDGKIPVVAAPHNIGIDESSRDFSSGGRKKTAFQLAQEFLNASGKAEWGVVANGRAIRLVRSSDFLTRPRFIEFDLERILNEDRYPDFKAVWYMFHHSRSRLRDGFDIPIWEEWVKLGVEKGSRVRERLRYGVGNALLALGNGFVSHMDNVALRNNLSGGEMPVHDFYRELLRLIYRMLFVITLEERNLLHEGAESTKAVQIYASGYSFRRLRDRSLKTSESAIYSDLWHSMRIVFRGLASGEQLLALPPLGGLFASDQCPALDNCSISNRSLMFAMRNLRWADMDSVLTPVDYRNMGPEEIGSVYESLLEFEPMVNLGADAGARFRLPGLAADSAVAGNQRKTTGSYYTPESLVNELIKSALDPVLERVIRENPGNPAAALLKVSV